LRFDQRAKRRRPDADELLVRFRDRIFERAEVRWILEAVDDGGIHSCLLAPMQISTATRLD